MKNKFWVVSTISNVIKKYKSATCNWEVIVWNLFKRKNHNNGIKVKKYFHKSCSYKNFFLEWPMKWFHNRKIYLFYNCHAEFILFRLNFGNICRLNFKPFHYWKQQVNPRIFTTLINGSTHSCLTNTATKTLTIIFHVRH